MELDKPLENIIIKVVGVGGAGCHAVEHMIHDGMKGVEYICVDSDSTVLEQSSAGTKLLIVANLGSSDEMSAPIETAITERDRIINVLRGADMVFIIAGMGGNTGTYAARVVAELAYTYLEILTVAVVTSPFESENKRFHIAEEGLTELVQHIDSMIVLPNDKLKQMFAEQFNQPEFFRYADTTLKITVSSIADIINEPGLVGIDYSDVRVAMGNTGTGKVGFATTTGVDRACIAAEQALKSPLLEGCNLFGVYSFLVIFTASDIIRMHEIHEALEIIRSYDPDALFCGTSYEEGMGDSLRVTIIATEVDP